MATDDTKKPAVQPAEDMFGRPTSPRHAESEQRRDTRPERDNTGSLKSTEEEEEGEARHADSGIDDIPDGDGPRSDRGTNPLPETYWADFPGGKP